MGENLISVQNATDGMMLGLIAETILSPGTHYVIGSIFSSPNVSFGDGATPAEFPEEVELAPTIVPGESFGK